MHDFAFRLIHWHHLNGRHDLPWQNTRDPYRIWLSEIMLQQTQVTTVIPYYLRFLEQFPDLQSLAHAELDDVLACWSGLGYYSRARNLHRAARIIVDQHGGEFPRDLNAMIELPGIGRSTAAAITVFAHGARNAILDGNVKRVLARHLGVEGYPGERSVEHALWGKAEALLPEENIATYTQALMDLGATLCTRSKPSCGLCPVQGDCLAFSQGRQGDFPTPRPARRPPQKETVFLILQRGGDIVLEKRSPTGIWGGLWSLPEMKPGEDAVAYCLHRFGATVEVTESMAILEHAFSHFKLRIHPQRCRVIGEANRVQEPSYLWIGIDDALGAAIPAPVRRLLEGLTTPRI